MKKGRKEERREEGREEEEGGGKVRRRRSLYNSMVQLHLQYCLMMLGDFEAGRNKAYGGTLLKLQKRFVGLIVGKVGRHHECTKPQIMIPSYAVL
jgi:hypothetical protein